MKFQINLGKRIITLILTSRSQRETLVHGYCNRCTDGKYIIFLDYDNSEQSWVKEEIKHLQYEFYLSDFYLFKSGPNNFHAVCFDKVVLSEYLEILKNSSVDVDYINVPLHYGKKIWTLRLTDKNRKEIKLVEVIKSDLNVHKQSSAHTDIINALFKLNIKLLSPDNEKRLILARYRI